MPYLRTRAATVLIALSLIAGAPAASVQASNAAPQAVAAKHCRPGYVRARLPSGVKCLHVGQFCSRKRTFQRVYHRYGFYCARNHRLRSR